MKSLHFHKTTAGFSSLLGEVVFGAEDGMVSTLGAVSGIAIGSGDTFTILLAGIVIICVESVSMGIGSFISNSSSHEVDAKSVEEEKDLLKRFPSEEKKELFTLLVRDGWKKEFAAKMAEMASVDHRVMLREHEYRELGIFPYKHDKPVKNAFFMFISYIIGGLIPLTAYFFLPVRPAVNLSVVMTLIGLFILGVGTSRFTSVKPLREGFRFMVLGGIAFLVGMLVGSVSVFFG